MTLPSAWNRWSLLAAVLAAVLAACGGAGRARSSSSPASNHACVAVRVVDELGAPIAGSRVHAEASAWVGPDGAFFYEGGQPMMLSGVSATTGSSGTVCIDDPSAKLADMRARADRQVASAGSRASGVAYIGGLGPMRVGPSRGVVVADYAGWPSTRVEDTVMRTLASSTALTLVIGPPRSAAVAVTSPCDPRSISATATHADVTVRGVVASLDADGATLRFDGLGPALYTVAVHSCDGEAATVVLDAGPLERERRIEIATRTVAPSPRGAPGGRVIQLALAIGGGCVVTDTHDLGCFDTLYERTDLSPPRLVPAWIDVGELGATVPVAALAGAAYATCVLATDGTVRCWGAYAPTGMLGTAHSAPVSAPITIDLPARAVEVAVSGHACARLETGAVMCWGANDYGQLGTGDRNAVNVVPREVPGLRDATGIAVGSMHTCAITPRRQVACAGWNKYGQVGSGPHTSSSYVVTPTVVAGIADIIRIAADASATYAWDSSGREFAWGRLPGSMELRSPRVLVSASSGTTARAEDRECRLLGTGAILCNALANPPRPSRGPDLPMSLAE